MIRCKYRSWQLITPTSTDAIAKHEARIKNINELAPSLPCFRVLTANVTKLFHILGENFRLIYYQIIIYYYNFLLLLNFQFLISIFGLRLIFPLD